MRETLGQRLQRLRITAGLTQLQVADVAGVPVTTLRGWEVDRREPGFRAAVRLAKALGVSVEVLADTVPVEEVGRVPRPAGPSRKPEDGSTKTTPAKKRRK
jgi:transcriptional regulator with XRE-family HTH domain